MTVADLIRELQDMPNQHAAVYVRIVIARIDDTGADWEEASVEDVRNEGPFVTIRTN